METNAVAVMVEQNIGRRPSANQPSRDLSTDIKKNNPRSCTSMNSGSTKIGSTYVYLIAAWHQNLFFFDKQFELFPTRFRGRIKLANETNRRTGAEKWQIFRNCPVTLHLSRHLRYDPSELNFAEMYPNKNCSNENEPHTRCETPTRKIFRRLVNDVSNKMNIESVYRSKFPLQDLTTFPRQRVSCVALPDNAQVWTPAELSDIKMDSLFFLSFFNRRPRSARDLHEKCSHGNVRSEGYKAGRFLRMSSRKHGGQRDLRGKCRIRSLAIWWCARLRQRVGLKQEMKYNKDDFTVSRVQSKDAENHSSRIPDLSALFNNRN